MTTLTIGDRTIELPKYNLKLMRIAAPAMDRVLKAASQLGFDVVDIEAGGDSMPAFEPLIELQSDMIEVIAVGASQVDATLDAAFLESKFGLSDMGMLQAVFSGIMTDAGVATMASTGNVAAAPEPAPAP